MSRRGQKPGQIRLKVLAGAKKSRIPGSPMTSADLPQCPIWLDRDGKRVWKEIVPALHEIGILHRIDRQALSIYAQAYSRWRDASRALKDGLTISTHLGGEKSHPAIATIAMAERTMLSILGEFGMTPVARSRLKPDEKAADALGTFLKRKRG